MKITYQTKPNEGVLTLSEGFDDEGEAEEAEKEGVQFLESGEDTSIALEPSEEPFNLVSLAVESAVVAPWIDTVGFGWHHRDHVDIQHQLAGLVFFVGAIHQQRHAGNRP